MSALVMIEAPALPKVECKADNISDAERITMLKEAYSNTGKFNKAAVEYKFRLCCLIGEQLDALKKGNGMEIGKAFARTIFHFHHRTCLSPLELGRVVW